MYKEEEFLQLSGIQHFAFCRRQWALAYIELQWKENVRTVEGKLLHEKAHDVKSGEKRRDILISRAMPICSRELGISGECDIVEFHRVEEGISIYGRDGKFQVVPVEYKRGSPKKDKVDILQLAAQTMCLEEMLCCQIAYGYLFYGETRHREKVEITEEIRTEVKSMFQEMHKYFENGFTPKVKWSKSCNACSLKDLCMPVLGKNISVTNYMDAYINDDI